MSTSEGLFDKGLTLLRGFIGRPQTDAPAPMAWTLRWGSLANDLSRVVSRGLEPWPSLALLRGEGADPSKAVLVLYVTSEVTSDVLRAGLDTLEQRGMRAVIGVDPAALRSGVLAGSDLEAIYASGSVVGLHLPLGREARSAGSLREALQRGIEALEEITEPKIVWATTDSPGDGLLETLAREMGLAHLIVRGGERRDFVLGSSPIA